MPPARKRRHPKTTTPVVPPLPTVRIGFSREALAFFDGLSEKMKSGLRRKLHDFERDPRFGKPLVGALQGYHRVTYGRLRAITAAISNASEGVVIVHVLYMGLRKEGSQDDPYEVAAAKAIQRGEPDAISALEAMIHHELGSQRPDDA